MQNLCPHSSPVKYYKNSTYAFYDYGQKCCFKNYLQMLKYSEIMTNVQQKISSNLDMDNRTGSEDSKTCVQPA